MTPTALPDLRRLRYFHGQLLGATDLRREQDYFREKLRLRNRCEHGHGVLCGLFVRPVGAEHPCAPEAADYGGPDVERHNGLPRVRITRGVAVDCAGDEIVVPGSCPVDLWRALPPDERRRFRDGDSLYLSIRFCERAVEPTRAVYTDNCGDTADCAYGWTKESFRIEVSLQAPKDDKCAGTCCTVCPDPRLLLARIDDVQRGQPVTTDAIHLNVRRPFGRYRFTTITGISWTHGGTYPLDASKELLGTLDKSKGLVVRFSDQVRIASLQPGVVDVQVIQGGQGRGAEPWYIAGTFEGLPAGGLTDRFRYTQVTKETLQEGDRVLITIRTPFILDRCCRPVDGTHVGGRVPILPGYPVGQLPPVPNPDPCALPPSRIGPWTSGTGTGDGVFESWFYVEAARP